MAQFDRLIIIVYTLPSQSHIGDTRTPILFSAGWMNLRKEISILWILVAFNTNPVFGKNTAFTTALGYSMSCWPSTVVVVVRTKKNYRIWKAQLPFKYANRVELRNIRRIVDPYGFPKGFKKII